MFTGYFWLIFIEALYYDQNVNLERCRINPNLNVNQAERGSFLTLFAVKSFGVKWDYSLNFTIKIQGLKINSVNIL